MKTRKKRRRSKSSPKLPPAKPPSPPITIVIPAASLNSINVTGSTGKRKRSSSDVEALQPPKKVAKVSPSPRKKTTTPKVANETPKKVKPMPLYKAISNIIKQLIHQDKQSIFYAEVTDDIAPGYSDVVKYPMCFTKMRDKLTKRLYTTLEAAQMDLKLVFQNAMAYNPPGTIYYDEAKRVLALARTITSNYKKKVDPAFYGASDPLFTDEEAVPIAIDPADLIPKPKSRVDPVKEIISENVPTPSPRQRNRPTTYRKRKKDSITASKSSLASSFSGLPTVTPFQPPPPPIPTS